MLLFCLSVLFVFFFKNTVCSVIISIICFRSSKQPAWVGFGFGVVFGFFFQTWRNCPPVAWTCCLPFLSNGLFSFLLVPIPCVCLRITPLSLVHWCRSMEDLGQGAVLSTSAARHNKWAELPQILWDETHSRQCTESRAYLTRGSKKCQRPVTLECCVTQVLAQMLLLPEWSQRRQWVVPAFLSAKARGWGWCVHSPLPGECSRLTPASLLKCIQT